MMGDQHRHHGSLIAFEGPENLISTQLRLLPASPQILILPSLQHYMKGDTGTDFSSRSCIQDVHQAAQARHQDALQFLNKSTSNNKRLVFLNGGTAGAVSQCITTISERQASGDVGIAEAIFKNIVNEGVMGLGEDAKYLVQEAPDSASSEQDQFELPGQDDNEDPITKAMRAVDALYKETDSLQPMDCYIRTRPRSLSLPMLDHAIEMGQASPFFVFGTSPSEDPGSPFRDDNTDLTTAGAEDNSNEADNMKTAQGGPKLRVFVPPRPASSVVESSRHCTGAIRSTCQVFSPAANGFTSPPTTPEGVVYGEARLVQMAASKSQGRLRRVRSLDDMELSEARRRRISIKLTPATTRALRANSPGTKSRHLSIVEDPYSPNSLLHLPQAKFVKAQTTTIRRSPTFLRLKNSQPARDTYVHHGTDTATFSSTDEVELERSFEPVLPLNEDLVLHFTSFSRDYTLDSVIQSYKDGSYPVTSYMADSYSADTDSCPSTPRTEDLFDRESHVKGLSPVAEVPSSDEASDYDPHAVRGNHVRQPSNMTQQTVGPPPREPQPPPTPHVESKFYAFATAGRANAIATQNALRVVLERFYPQQEGTGCCQFSSALLAYMGKLWRPVFRTPETRGGKLAQASADLILAIGCQSGVDSGFVGAITGQVEKLGSQSSGMSRSGRLDIRYLIATAMQSFSTQPLASVLVNSPSDSPYILACLLIPHLETYLTTNPETRFLLLSYPAEHLATVLSLQKLIGADMLRIAGIIDTSDAHVASSADFASANALLSSNSSLRSYPSVASIERLVEVPNLVTCTSLQLSSTAPAESKLPSRPTLAHRRRVSFSRADYTLASTSTAAEIAALISNIWKVLIEIDAFYKPESKTLSNRVSTVPARSKSARAAAPPALLSKFTSAGRTQGLPISPPLSPDGGSILNELAAPRSVMAQNPAHAAPPSPSRHLSGLAGMPRSPMRGLLALAGDDAMSAYAMSIADEGEFYDDEERRLMPTYMRQHELRKMNSRKALKWLGLA